MFIFNISVIKFRVEFIWIEIFFIYFLEFKGYFYGNEGCYICVYDVRSVYGNIGFVNVYIE